MYGSNFRKYSLTIVYKLYLFQEAVSKTKSSYTETIFSIRTDVFELEIITFIIPFTIVFYACS